MRRLAMPNYLPGRTPDQRFVDLARVSAVLAIVTFAMDQWLLSVLFGLSCIGHLVMGRLLRPRGADGVVVRGSAPRLGVPHRRGGRARRRR